MYFLDSLQYPFRGQGAFGKIVTAGLLLFIPIVNLFGAFVIAGYGIKIMGNVLAGNQNLPEFDIMQDFGRGLLVLLAGFIYALPLVLVLLVLGLLLGGFNEDTMTAGGLLLTLISIPLSFIFSLVIITAFSRYAATEETGMLFDFGGNFRLAMNNLGAGLEFFVNAFLYGIAVAILVSLGFMLLVIPGLILSVAAQFGQYHLYAQYARRIGIGGKRKVDTFAL